MNSLLSKFDSFFEIISKKIENKIKKNNVLYRTLYIHHSKYILLFGLIFSIILSIILTLLTSVFRM